MATPLFKISGHKELTKKLLELAGAKTTKRVLRKALNAAAQPTVKEVRRRFPKDTGLSKKAVTKKVYGSDGQYHAIVGVDRSVMAPGIGENGRQHIPGYIDHLIEYGYQARDGTNVPAKAPVRQGAEAARGESESKLIEKTVKEYDRIIAKLAAKQSK